MSNSRDLLISFSGGETSAYMTMLILKHWRDLYDNIVVVFANTSKETEETLEFIKKCDDQYGFDTVWIEAVFDGVKRTGWKVVDFDTAKRNGEVFEAMIKAYGMPNFAFPHCTRELKTQPIRAYTRSILGSGFYTAIGIRADEVDRVNAEHKKNRFEYPLVSAGVTKKDINEFWQQQPFRLNLKSYEGNCDLCWKKTPRKLMSILKHSPEKADWWIDIENKYGGYIPMHRDRKSGITPKTFKHNQSIQDILEMSKSPFLQPSRDDRFDYNIQRSIFDEDLDKSYGCEESCEPF